MHLVLPGAINEGCLLALISRDVALSLPIYVRACAYYTEELGDIFSYYLASFKRYRFEIAT
jgi:hypothetical protein